MLLFLVLMFGDLTVERYHIADASYLDGFVSSSELPIAMLSTMDQIYVLDGDARLWLLGQHNRQAPADPTLSPAGVRGLYPLDDKIVVIDQNGYRRTTYSQDGVLIGSTLNREPSLYEDLDNRVSAANPHGITAQNAVRVTWSHQRLARQIDLLVSDQDDSVHPDSILAQRLGDLLLVMNGQSRQGRGYFAILNLKTGQLIRTGQLQSASAPATATDPTPLWTGMAANHAQGFVLTAAEKTNHRRNLYVLGPDQDHWRQYSVELEPDQDLVFFQPLEDGTWIAFQGTRLLHFRLAANP